MTLEELLEKLPVLPCWFYLLWTMSIIFCLGLPFYSRWRIGCDAPVKCSARDWFVYLLESSSICVPVERSRLVFVMGDHFVLLVDRLLTESTLEAAIESINHGPSIPLSTLEADYSPTKKIIGDGVFTGKMVECRICQDEDEDIRMEIPCSCCGSLKFAHRKCVQKWCNEKGDTTCEICLQQFKPGYTAPPKLFLYGTTPMHFRGNWEVSRQNLHNQHSVTMAQTEDVFLRPTYDYAALSDRSIIYCRIAATTFMIILVLWHSLTFFTNEAEHCSILLFTFWLLKIVGIILPIYVMSRAVSIFYQRKLQAMHESSISASQVGNQHPHPSQRIQP